MTQILPALLSIASVFTGIVAAAGPVPREDTLFEIIRTLDARLFEASLRCDIDTFANLVDEDFEFYHDRTGLTVGKAALVETTRKNLCGKVRRELVASSLEVFPLQHYGAVETGSHSFCNLVETPLCRPETSGTGRFVMLWRQRPAGFKLARVISYDHVDSEQRGAVPKSR